MPVVVIPLVGSVFTALVLCAAVGWPIWVLKFSPKSDDARIRRGLEAPGRHVAAIRRVGTRWPFPRGSSWKREYEVTVSGLAGETLICRLYVDATLFTDPGLWEAPSGRAVVRYF